MRLRDLPVLSAEAARPAWQTVDTPDTPSAADGALGFLTDTTLCIGCKACEVACKQWNQLPAEPGAWSASSYDNTRDLGATTWRHVAFVERVADESGARPTELPPFQSSWLMMSDICKHCAHAGCLQACPTGAIVRSEFGTVVIQQDVCNGCGYCVPACPFGVPDLDLPHPNTPDHAGTAQRGVVRGIGQSGHRGRTDRLGHTGQGGHTGTARKCTLCYDRLKDDLEPACAKSCPTDSIQFGRVDELVQRARARVADLQARGVTGAHVYGDDQEGGTGGIGGLHSFFLLTAPSETYNLPAHPELPQRKTIPGLLTTMATAALIGAAAFFSLREEDPS
jgi:formate dehydrogenase iron-sulfur subunit